ncbi:MAG: T9SS type A sorting domain-containing protein, partial [Chitinophagales bacterium]
VTVQSEENYPMQIQLKDMNGALVLETQTQEVSGAENTFHYAIDHLQSGIYIANVLMDHQMVFSQKIVVLK